MSGDDVQHRCSTEQTITESDEQRRGLSGQPSGEDRRGTQVGGGDRESDQTSGCFHRAIQACQQSRSQSNQTESYSEDPGRVDTRQEVVLVTGASSGIGEAAALEFAKLGYCVVITGRNQERLDHVFKSITEASPGKDPSNFLAIQADFEYPSQVPPVVEKTIDKFGRLDIFVNNAGYPGQRRSLTDPDFFEDFQKILQVNLMAATQLAHLATPHIIKTGGVILNISSVADRIAIPSISYSVSKAGLSMLTKTLANALEGTRVRVVGVCPGPISTNFSPNTRAGAMGKLTSLGRSGESKEVADLIVFLSSDKASFIHGCNVDIDGGSVAKFGGALSQYKKPFVAEESSQ